MNFQYFFFALVLCLLPVPARAAATQPTEKPSGDSGKKDPPPDYLLPIVIVGSITLGAVLTTVLVIAILKKKKNVA